MTKRIVAAFGVLAIGVVVRAEAPWTQDKLSPAARRVVHERMHDHAHAMSSLIWDVILLDYDRAVQSAAVIADGARPLDRNAPELEHHVYFFALQDELQKQALALGDAARARDGLALGAAFKQLSETCVHCHVVYLDRPLPTARPARP